MAHTMRTLILALCPVWLATHDARGQSVDQTELRVADRAPAEQPVAELTPAARLMAKRPVNARPADPALAGGAETLGTIRGTLNGEERTWYVVEGSSQAKPYSSATWYEIGGERIVAVGGYDTEAPPLDTFEFDMATGAASFGDYQGSVLVLLARP